MNLPTQEKFFDFSGNLRIFEYSYDEVLLGHSVSAREQAAESGYEFESFSEASPLLALALMRDKIRKRISTRYLRSENNQPHLYFGRAIGHISNDGIVVDGIHIHFDQLATALKTYEGHLIEISIRDLSDE